MQQLLKLAPATAVIVTTDEEGRCISEEEVSIALVQRGDILKVRSMDRHSSFPIQHVKKGDA